jgi:3-oxoacyl-[acyl-carrier-protein] synthase II
MIGHLLGAAGAVEGIVCVKAVMEDYIHATVNSKEADAECDLNYVFGEGVKTKVEYALSNSLGFGGHNASILIAKYRG